MKGNIKEKRREEVAFWESVTDSGQWVTLWPGAL